MCIVKKWCLQINMKKTQYLVVNRNGKQPKCKLYFGENIVKQTNEYCYLGVMITACGSFSSAMKMLYKKGLKVDREDHFWRPGFFNIIIYVFLGYNVSNFVKNWMSPMFKIPPNVKGLTVNLVQGLFKRCSYFQIFLLFL